MLCALHEMRIEFMEILYPLLGWMAILLIILCVIYNPVIEEMRYWKFQLWKQCFWVTGGSILILVVAFAISMVVISFRYPLEVGGN